MITHVETHRPATIERRRELFAEASELLRREYHRDLTVESVARRLACSRRQLQRVFAESGTSFRDALLAIRMQKARELLLDSGEPVRVIAQRVGYQHPSQFAHAFRRACGMSPTQMRGLRQDPALSRAA